MRGSLMQQMTKRSLSHIPRFTQTNNPQHGNQQHGNQQRNSNHHHHHHQGITQHYSGKHGTRKLCGYQINPIGFGAMGLSIDGRPSEQDAIRTIHAALDAGMNLIDTANVYSLGAKDLGHGERLVARAVREWKGDQSNILVTTKGGMERIGSKWAINASPSHLRDACFRSLEALQVSSIDLYQLHAVDPNVPFSDSIRELRMLQREGLIRNIGLSNVTLDQLIEAREMVDVVSVQNRLSLFESAAITSGLVSYCQKAGIIFMAYSPLGGFHGHTRLAQLSQLEEICKEHNCTKYQLGLAYLLHLSPNIIPIPGSRSPERASSNAKAASLRLSEDTIKHLFQMNSKTEK